MNSKPFAPRYILPLLVVASVSIALVAWNGHQQQFPSHRFQYVNDTTPKAKTDKKVRDLDDVIDELDNAEIKMNLEKAQQEIKDAMKNIDMEKTKLEIDKAMKEVDMEKIKDQVEKATKSIDAEKIKQQIDESLAKVDMKKVNEEMQKAMAEVKKIDMEKLNESMKQVEIQMKDLGPKIEKEMEKAKAGIEKAKVEMKEYKGFVDGLDKDGLINKKEEYSIEHKNGELIINGKKQGADVYDKYREFLEKHKKFTIKKSGDDFNIFNGNDDGNLI